MPVLPARLRRLSTIARQSVWPTHPRHMVVMLHLGRCGSTVLADQVGQHTEVRWEGELFEKMVRGQVPEHRVIQDPFRLLRLRRAYAGRRIYGVEIKFHRHYHLGFRGVNRSAAACLAELKSIGATHFVILKRKNYLRQIVSEYVGRAKGYWHQKSTDAPSRLTVTLDPERIRHGSAELPLLDAFRDRDNAYAEMDRLLKGEEVLQLSYEEDVLDDPRQGYRQLCEFLGLRPIDTHIGTRRTNPYPLPALIDNIDAVADRLQGTPYAWMLSD